MADGNPEPWRILIADDDPAHVTAMGDVAERIGAVVVAGSVHTAEASRLATELAPDVAVVGVDHDRDHALGLIRELAQAGICPVIVALRTPDPAFVALAAERGAFAVASPFEPEELSSAIEVAVRRFHDVEALEEAIARRAIIERAKGVVMERYQLDAEQAFELLRRQARTTGTRLTAAADLVVRGHRFLPREP